MHLSKNILKYKEIPHSELWRVNFLKELLDIRANIEESNTNFTLNEVNDLLFYLCCE